MKAILSRAAFSRIAALALAGTLGACASTGDTGSQVTRFHLGETTIARAQIAVEPVDAADANSLEYRTYADAVGRQLTRLGWTVVNTVGQSEQVALVDVEQGSREALRQRSPVTIGIGGGTGGWGSGVGGGIGFGIGGGKSGSVVATMLAVRIKRRSDTTVFWEGRASTEAKAGTPGADRGAAVNKLAEALFRDFPGESGRTIVVP